MYRFGFEYLGFPWVKGSGFETVGSRIQKGFGFWA